MVVSAQTLEADTKLILDSLPATTFKRSASPLLVMTVGLPGSGKSTFSFRLAPEIDAIILESDAARRVLVSVPEHTSSEDRRVWNAIHKATAELLSHGVGLILDATNLIEANRRSLYQLADQACARLVIVEVTAETSVIARRLAEREQGEKAQGGATDWYHLYRRMAASRQPVSREHLIVDTSDPSAYEAGFLRVVEACRQERVGERMGGKP